ncbi:hypothetical protein [Rhodanobacter fulvus]|jgi:hypothetical protein|uniref:hypothetical protein n=1 Tax=Rhodanobacter fulvus TaxID=219571 RepID=UPI0012EA327A|nr:hypothetical protein [Rhodanobacter fulvus]
MKKFIVAFLLGLIATLLIMALGFVVATLRLLVEGHGFHEIVSNFYRSTFLGRGWRIALVPGVAIFLLSLIGGPRLRPPH